MAPTGGIVLRERSGTATATSQADAMPEQADMMAAIQVIAKRGALDVGLWDRTSSDSSRQAPACVKQAQAEMLADGLIRSGTEEMFKPNRRSRFAGFVLTDQLATKQIQISLDCTGDGGNVSDAGPVDTRSTD
jgi:hypothetical protein